MQIIPAIDIIDGCCVRLQQGSYERQVTYSDNPVDMARRFEDMGAKRLHIVDLDGAKSSHVVNLKVLEQIAHDTNLVIDFGGGIKQRSDLQKVFDSGAAMATIGSIAATDSPTVLSWAKEYGACRLIVGADALDGRIMIRGWKDDGGISLFDFIKMYMDAGIQRVLCTDISRDGMLQGPNVNLYKDIMKQFPHCQLICSGGVSSVDDLNMLAKVDMPAVVFGKAFYEGRITEAQLREILLR